MKSGEGRRNLHIGAAFVSILVALGDSKGNLYTTETYEGKRVQKFLYKGIGTVRAGSQGVLWPRSG